MNNLNEVEDFLAGLSHIFPTSTRGVGGQGRSHLEVFNGTIGKPNPLPLFYSSKRPGDANNVVGVTAHEDVR